jgi:hypothetical protein
MGDCIMAISEARKPAGDGKSKQVWGQGPADVIGSVRTVYGADTVLTYYRMTPTQIAQHYDRRESRDPAVGEQYLKTLDHQRIAPVILDIAKARDGSTRGEIAMEFHFDRLAFRAGVDRTRGSEHRQFAGECPAS